MHHYCEREYFERYYKDFSQKADQVFKSNFNLTIFDKHKQSYRNILKEGRTEEFDSASLTAEQVDEKTEYIKKEFHKNFPETREENIKIFREYLQLLKNNNIKTIVVIPPLSKFYEERISAKLREETLEIIQNAGNEYDFTFLDFSDNTLFDDKYFTDGAHLNEKGAEKFTDIVNQYISER
jgi:RNase H-fold protein (predicted Holliday junction resolvase)